MKLGKLTLCLLLAAALLLPVAGIGEEEENPTNIFTLIEANDLYGEAFDASAFDGTITLLNIWASWCGPCVMEIPYLNEIAEEYAGRMNVVGVQMDAVKNDLTTDEKALESARALWEKHGVQYRSLVPDNLLIAMTQQAGVSAFPTTWFVDANGYLRYMITGARDADGWRALIDQVLTAIESEGETV